MRAVGWSETTTSNPAASVTFSALFDGGLVVDHQQSVAE